MEEQKIFYVLTTFSRLSITHMNKYKIKKYIFERDFGPLPF